MKHQYMNPMTKLLRMEAEQLLDVSAKDEYSPNPSYSKENVAEVPVIREAKMVWDE